MLDQTKRAARLRTPLGDKELALARFTALEGLSELFEIDIEALSPTADIDFDAALGQPCVITSEAPDAPERHHHGVLVHAEWVGMRHDLHIYKMTLRPWLWLLGKTSDCRIFHDKTVIDIVKATFADHGFSDYRVAATADYPTLPYTVQYRETDLAFVCRLMEQHGVYYFFEHEEGVHRLVLADGLASHQPAPGLATIPYVPVDEAAERARRQHLWQWTSRRDFRSGQFAMNDYNHLLPNRRMAVERAGVNSYTRSNLKVYDHPGAYDAPDHGEFYARIELEAEQALDRRRDGVGEAVSLFPGALVTLTDHPRGGENRDYLVVRTRHEFVTQDYRSNMAVAPPAAPDWIELLPTERPFRAPLATPKPLIHSLHTALVTGAEGEEIDCDDHGRILVHFYWDRHNDKSCRVRVSQVWGGQGWGGQVIPRIGMEVMVAFIDGDPDRPIVVGCVPNPQTLKVPYELPANKTRMTLKSKTYKGEGFNELRFEDLTNQEEIFIHAQKDKNVKIENNLSQRVNVNQLESIGFNKAIEVGNDHKEVIGGDMELYVGPSQSGAVVPKDAGKTPEGLGRMSYSLGDPKSAPKGTGNLKISVEKSRTAAIGEFDVTRVAKNKETFVEKDYDIDVQNEMVIKAGKKLTIIVGGCQLIMAADGSVTINGKHLTTTLTDLIAMHCQIVKVN